MLKSEKYLSKLKMLAVAFPSPILIQNVTLNSKL